MIYFLFDLDDTLIIHDHGRHLNYEMIQPDYRLNNLLSRIRGEFIFIQMEQVNI